MKRLIVNADDYGLTAGINAGIEQAFEQGIVRSTSLMVRQPAAAAAGAYARAHPELGVGLHLDLWEFVPEGESWRCLYRHCAEEPAAIAAELDAQWSLFTELVGRPPDHLNTHQHVHQGEPAGSAVRALAARTGLPIRGLAGVGYVGDFYGQDGFGRPWPQCVSVDHLLGLIDALQEGWTEFGCHPGIVGGGESLGGTMYRTERNEEIRSLCDRRVLQRLAHGDVRLARWSDFAADQGRR